MYNDVISLGVGERRKLTVILLPCGAFCFHFDIQVTCVGCMPDES